MTIKVTLPLPISHWADFSDMLTFYTGITLFLANLIHTCLHISPSRPFDTRSGWGLNGDTDWSKTQTVRTWQWTSRSGKPIFFSRRWCRLRLWNNVRYEMRFKKFSPGKIDCRACYEMKFIIFSISLLVSVSTQNKHLKWRLCADKPPPVSSQ